MGGREGYLDRYGKEVFRREGRKYFEIITMRKYAGGRERFKESYFMILWPRLVDVCENFPSIVFVKY